MYIDVAEEFKLEYSQEYVPYWRGLILDILNSDLVGTILGITDKIAGHDFTNKHLNRRSEVTSYLFQRA